MTDIATRATSGSDVAGAIRTAKRQFMKAFQKRDAAEAARLYTNDALLCPPGADITEGADAIIRFWTSVMESGVTDLKLDTVSVKALGTTAIERGKYTLISGSEAVDTGKYLVVWRLEEDSWRLFREIWNSNLLGRLEA